MSGFFSSLARIGLAIGSAYIGNGAGLALALGGNVVLGRYDARLARKRAAANRRQGELSLNIPAAPRRRIYGTRRVEGVLRYWVTHGPEERFVSLVYLIADHECEAIEDVQFDEVSIGPLDGSGYVQAGSPWFRSSTYANAQELGATAGTITLPSATVARPTISVAAVYFPDLPQSLTASGFVDLGPSDFAHTVGSTSITLGGALAGLTIPSSHIVVNWTSAVGTPLARVRKHLGAAIPQTADATLVTDSGGEWSAACRLDGQTYIVVTLEWDERIGAGNVPIVHAVVKGAKVFDPRTGTTGWSDNWALCTRDWLKATTGCEDEEIDDDLVEASADASDEWVTVGAAKTITSISKATQAVVVATGHDLDVGDAVLFDVAGMTQLDNVRATVVSRANGNEVAIGVNSSAFGTFTSGTFVPQLRRYSINGEIASTRDPFEVAEELALAGAGTIAWSAGKFRILAGKYWTPAPIELFERDFAGGRVRYEPKAPRETRFNTVSGRFFDRRTVGSTRLYSHTTYATYSSSAYIAEDRGRPIKRSIDFEFVTDYRAANRLAKQIMHRARQGARLTARFKLKALPLQVGDFVQVTNARYGIEAKVFEIMRAAYYFPNTVELTLQETAAEAFDWAYTEAAFVDPAPNTMLRNPTDVDRPILSVHCTADDPPTIKTLADGSEIAYARVSWPLRANAAEYVSLRWKRSFETAYRTVDARPGETFADLDAISGGDVLQILGYAVNSINARSDPWVVQEFHVDARLPRFKGVLPALSANLIANATLEVNGQRWSTFEIGIPAGVSSFAKWTGTNGTVRGVPSSCVLLVNSSATGDGLAGAVQSAPFAVKPGRRHSVYVGLIGYGTDCYVAVGWYDAAGQLLKVDAGNVIAGGLLSAAGYWDRPDAYAISEVAAVAPAGAVQGREIIYATGNWAAVPAKAVSVFQPFAGEVPDGSVDRPVWHPGGSNIVDTSSIAPGATRRLSSASALLSGFIPAFQKGTLVPAGDFASITGDFDGTGLPVLVTVTGNVEQLSDGSGNPIEIQGVIRGGGATMETAPARVLLYLASTPVSPAAQVRQKAGFEVSHRFVLGAPLPGTGIRYSFEFYAMAPAGTVTSIVSFQNVNITFDIAR